jgi:hypothetical protein
MAKYRKKPVIIDAVLFDGTLSCVEQLGAYQGSVSQELTGNTVQIETLEGTMTANIGDYIIKGVKGEIYPCKADIFEATYDVA